jgi:signal transduction histidine kinase
MERTQRLVRAVQELSLARDLATVMAIVRTAARELTGADGATFVLRDGDHCHYADEDAIAPLWKGQRFPLETCVSGWAMLNRQHVVIEEIESDSRIPSDVYRPTFVKSLVMVPIRSMSPVGAIGNYWATRHRATSEEVELLSALANSTSVAMENIDVYRTLERRIEERTAELREVERQKTEMAALLAHDLKSPANGILLTCRARLRKSDLPEAERRWWRGVEASAEVINRLALNLVDIARSDDGAFTPRPVEIDLRAMLASVVERMAPLAEAREQRIELEVAGLGEGEAARVRADEELLHRVLQNLVDNALRHNRSEVVRVEARDAGERVELRVVDEGPGVPEAMRQEVFDKYRRLDDGGAVGHGLGLAFCRIAVEAHGGRIWVEPNAPAGAAFVIELPRR